jgi:FK506-binding protein 2
MAQRKTRRFVMALCCFCGSMPTTQSLVVHVNRNAAARHTTSHSLAMTQRRTLLARATAALLVTASSSILAVPAAAVRAAPPYPQLPDVTITLTEPSIRLGLELIDVTIGNNPPRTVPAVKRVVERTPTNAALQAGMILVPDTFASAVAVQERLRTGPYPITLTFRNLAAGGDAISDLGTPIVTAQDALDLARATSGSSSSSNRSGGMTFEITSVQTADHSCNNMRSRRGDVLEIIYEAHLNSADGVVYDSSMQRGTGLPYQMVLGSGDMLPGVDQGLYDMCPGDIRTIRIPPVLAYGARGNKIFAVPPNTPLYWEVQLVSVNSVRKGDLRTREEMEGRD